MPDYFTFDTIPPEGAVEPSGIVFTSLLQVDDYLDRHTGGSTCFWRNYYGDERITRHVARRATWREREQACFAEGCYLPPIWQFEPFWRSRSPALIDHFAHVSVDEPEMIAFTEDPVKGEADRQTRMKPGRYLKRFFGDMLPEKRIAYLAEWFVTGAKPAVSKDGGMELATTVDAIVDVYRASVSSCMKSMSCVRVYAAGDLAVACWRDAEGDIQARCLCWPSRGVYGRIYPEASDDDYALALIQVMERQGWVHVRVHDDGFEGARLRKAVDSRGDYVMPYLDLGYGVNDAGDCWVMAANGEYVCDNTDGTLGPEAAGWTCDRCGEAMDECDASYTVHVRIVEGEARDEREYCYACQQTETFHCCWSSDRFDVSVPHVYVDDELWARAFADTGPDLFYDPETDTYSAVAPETETEGAP